MDRIAALEVIAAGKILESLHSSNSTERKTTIDHVVKTIHDVVTAVGQPVEFPVESKAHKKISRLGAIFFYTAPAPQGCILFDCSINEFSFSSSQSGIIISEVPQSPSSIKFSSRTFNLLLSLPEYPNPYVTLVGKVGDAKMQTYPGAILNSEQVSALTDIFKISASSLASAARAEEAKIR